jgi:putative nucleotidyltransferase with HDIG domain
MTLKTALEAVVTRLRLPTLPDQVLRIQRMAEDPSAGPADIGALITQDPGLAAKVLQVANSSYYGLREPVLTCEQAAVVIGSRSLRNIVLQVSIVQHFAHLSQHAEYDLDEVWSHAVAVAHLTQTLARMSRHRAGMAPEEYYTCGLLHDIGKVVLLESYGEQYLDVLRHARRAGQALHLSEEVVLGYTHVDVGALLAQKWKLPERVATAIEFHHGPTSRITSDPTISIVALADQLHYRSQHATFEASLSRLSELAQRLLGVEPRDFLGLAEMARTLERTAAV